MRFLFVLSLLVAALVSRPAFAQPPARAVIVVDVDAGASELDAATLRKSIGDELGMDAVAPDDPRAGSARGTIHVAIDRTTKKLVVSYRAHAAPIVRDVPLPDDPAGAVRAAVVLAGNLARDEATDLADELRKRAAKPAPAATSASPQNEYAALDATLSYHADQARRSRLAHGWTFLGVGVVAFGTGIYVNTQNAGVVGWGLDGVGVLSMVLGAVALGTESGLESLWQMRQSGEGGNTVEARWAEWAAKEHSARRTTGIFLLVFGSLSLASGALRIAYGSTASSGTVLDREDGAFEMALGAYFIGNGVYTLCVDGPTENALRLYEGGIGRKAPPEIMIASRFRVAAVPGGAVLGFGGAF